MIEALEGRSFAGGPFTVCREKVAEFVEATGDDARRWTEVAPPGFAAALLFVVAPHLLADPALSGAVVHGDQTFRWSAPLRVETTLDVTGTVDRVRTRSGVAFLTFSLNVAEESGRPVLEGRSTFLVGAAAEPSQPVDEVPALDRAETATASTDLPSPRSASRADLVRYASATRDWNPIHWDREAALSAGLGGVVVHGLLQSAWLTQVVAAARETEHPILSARYRYTSLLRPGAPAEIQGDLAADQPELRLICGQEPTVTGRFEVAK